MIDIPKPPEKGAKTVEQQLEDLERWAYKIYDALRYIIETNGEHNG